MIAAAPRHVHSPLQHLLAHATVGLAEGAFVLPVDVLLSVHPEPLDHKVPVEAQLLLPAAADHVGLLPLGRGGGGGQQRPGDQRTRWDKEALEAKADLRDRWRKRSTHLRARAASVHASSSFLWYSSVTKASPLSAVWKLT